MTRWAVLGAVAIVVFDLVLALGAMALGYDYDNWLGVGLAFIIIALFAGLAAREAGTARVGVGVGALVALADATVGWPITWAMGPGAPRTRDAFDNNALPGYVALSIAVWVAFGAVTGLVAGVHATRIRRTDAG